MSRPAFTPHPSPNHGPRPAGSVIDMLVLHYTGMETGQAALERLCDPAFEVSAHYLVLEDGHTLQLVPEHRRAWHAGPWEHLPRVTKQEPILLLLWAEQQASRRAR